MQTGDCKKEKRVLFTVLENGKLISNGTKIKKTLVRVWLVLFRKYLNGANIKFLIRKERLP
jgi:hypothetical protein